jgi:diguanylate cyclase (GGDEF)-like protein
MSNIDTLFEDCKQAIQYGSMPIQLSALAEIKQATDKLQKQAKTFEIEKETAEFRLFMLNNERDELKSRIESLEKIMILDDLTGAYNRRGLKKIALLLRSRLSHNHDMPVSLAFLDLDDFKSVNDMHGHPTGDAALQHFAEQVQKAIRGSDFFVRWAGDEFLLIMPDTKIPEAEIFMKRLHKKLEKSTFEHNGEHLHITASIGIAGLKKGESFEDLVARADEQVYRAKHNPDGVSTDD